MQEKTINKGGGLVDESDLTQRLEALSHTCDLHYFNTSSCAKYPKRSPLLLELLGRHSHQFLYLQDTLGHWWELGQSVQVVRTNLWPKLLVFVSDFIMPQHFMSSLYSSSSWSILPLKLDLMQWSSLETMKTSLIKTLVCKTQWDKNILRKKSRSSMVKGITSDWCQWVQALDKWTHTPLYLRP